MISTLRRLTAAEHKELEAKTTPTTYIVRAILWLLCVCLSSALFWNINYHIGKPVWWPLPSIIVAVGLYLLAGRFSGGSELRSRIRSDLRKGEAQEKIFKLSEMIVFPEADDEGPVCFFEDGGSIYCLAGQKMARLLGNGFPRSELVQTIAPLSGQLLSLKFRGQRVRVINATIPFRRSTIYNDRYFQKTICSVPISWMNVMKAAKANESSE